MKRSNIFFKYLRFIFSWSLFLIHEGSRGRKFKLYIHSCYPLYRHKKKRGKSWISFWCLVWTFASIRSTFFRRYLGIKCVGRIRKVPQNLFSWGKAMRSLFIYLFIFFDSNDKMEKIVEDSWKNWNCVPDIWFNTRSSLIIQILYRFCSFICLRSASKDRNV